LLKSNEVSLAVHLCYCFGRHFDYIHSKMNFVRLVNPLEVSFLLRI
jgi:hypothetical protein